MASSPPPLASGLRPVLNQHWGGSARGGPAPGPTHLPHHGSVLLPELQKDAQPADPAAGGTAPRWRPRPRSQSGRRRMGDGVPTPTQEAPSPESQPWAPRPRRPSPGKGTTWLFWPKGCFWGGRRTPGSPRALPVQGLLLRFRPWLPAAVLDCAQAAAGTGHPGPSLSVLFAASAFTAASASASVRRVKRVSFPVSVSPTLFPPGHALCSAPRFGRFTAFLLGVLPLRAHPGRFQGQILQ